MPYIDPSDRYYLENKYHFADQPFDGFRRMEYHGVPFDPETGLDDAEMKAELERLSETLDGEPRPIHKARLFAFVLDHTRIDTSEHDPFVGIWSWSRPISHLTVNRWYDELKADYPREWQGFSDAISAGFSYGGLDFDHTVPDWDALMSLGFPGLLERARSQYRQRKERGDLTPKQEAFFRGMEIEYEAVLRLLLRMAEYAARRGTARTDRTARCLRSLALGAPADTYEAMQLIYVYFMLSESVEHYQVRSLGFGLDQTLYPFYRRDLETGRYTKEELASLLAYFMIQWQSIGNYWGQPFYMAGTDARGETLVNELSYLILEVYDGLGLYNPKIQIKVSEATPRPFLMQALDMIRHGNTSIVFCSEDHIIRSLMSRGCTYEEAVDSVISGCYEYKPKSDSIALSGYYWGLLKPVSLVFDNGLDRVSGKQVGCETGDVTAFTSFRQFYQAYLEQLRYLMQKNLADLTPLEQRVGEVNPSLLYSCTMQRCVETMTDALDGGLNNTSDTLISGLGTATDALMAVYELVFETGVTDLATLKAALEANWVGYEALRARALACRHKYGRGDAMADRYAAAIVRAVSDCNASRINPHGGKTLLELHSARAFIIHGERTMATPDGRRMGEETSKNASPTPGADTKGITALIRSATGIDTSLTNNGFCLDAMLHPSAVSGEDGLEALYAVLMTYLRNGGGSIHFNIFSPEILRDAQEHPEKYRNLQVRVCGWNTLWNDMNRTEQDAYIRRAESIS